MSFFETTPLSRVDLINYARKIRKLLGIETLLYFPVVELFEKLPEIFPGCTTVVVEDTELAPNEHGATDITNKTIKIKETVYEGACAGSGRDRMTIVHEIAHYLLLVICSLQLKRTFGDVKPVSYKDPEWQAKALAGELMIPYDLTKDMSCDNIVMLCGVSQDSAACQKRSSHER